MITSVEMIFKGTINNVVFKDKEEYEAVYGAIEAIEKQTGIANITSERLVRALLDVFSEADDVSTEETKTDYTTHQEATIAYDEDRL